jgi:D-glycero-alpha-D-manno-heptose-7-phosphate kinase
MADMPGRSGLVSSSAFTAGVIQNLSYRQDSVLTQEDLFEKTVDLERVVLNEPGGWQDQAATIFGDLRTYKFSSSGIEVSSPLLSADTKTDLSKCQLLISTNVFRDSHLAAAASSERAKSSNNWEQINAAAEIAEKLSERLQTTHQSVESALLAISEALNEHWEIKKQWQSTQILDLVADIELTAKKFGILGHKLLGAGDGGYVLITAESADIARIKRYFGEARCSEFKSVKNGTSTFSLKE